MTWIKTCRAEPSPVFKSECKRMKLLPGAQQRLVIRVGASELDRGTKGRRGMEWREKRRKFSDYRSRAGITRKLIMFELQDVSLTCIPSKA